MTWKVVTVVYVGFVLTGVVTTLLGPLIPILSGRWELSDSQAGYLFTAQFSGSITGTLASGRLAARFGFMRILAAGYGLMLAGVTVLAFGSWPLGVISVLCYGIALGLTIPTTNLLISDANPTRRAAALNLLNVAWSLGAVIGPPIIARLIRGDTMAHPLIGLSTFLALVAAWCFKNSFISPAQPPSHLASHKESVPEGRGLGWRNPFLPLFGAVMFLYVGTENSIAGWIASYAQRLEASQRSIWALTPSFFWAALLLGRLIAPALLRQMTESRLVVSGLVIATTGAITLLLTKTMIGLFIGAALAGAGLAPVFPTTVAMFTDYFGKASSRISGLMFALGGLGGAILPWTVGFLSTTFGSLRSGMAFLSIGGPVMIACLLHFYSCRSARKPPTSC